MAIVFPASPSVNDTFTAGSITYKWDGDKWFGLGVTPADRLVEGSNKLEINASNELVWTGSDVGIGTNAPGSDGGTTLEIYNATTPTLKLNDGDEYKALLQLRGNDLEVRGSNGNIEFYTGNADGASSTERLRITSAGLLDVSGGIHVTENVTPTSGRGIEIFEAGTGVGQISSYNRDANGWDELRIKGSEIKIFTGTSNGLGLDLASSQSTLYGTSDGIFNLDTTDDRGAFIRFKENGTSKAWIGSAEGMGGGFASPDQDDLGLRAVGGIRFSTAGEERVRLEENGSVRLVLEGGTADPNARIDTSGDNLRIVTMKDGAGGCGFIIETQHAGSVSEKFRISTDGIVTKPKQPSFQCRKNGNFNFTANTDNTIAPWTEEHDTGADFNPTTGVFTAPVAGKYFFYLSVMAQRGGNGDYQIRIYKNGSQFVGSNDMNDAATTTFQQTTINAIVNCSANDSITFVARNGSDTTTFIYQTPYTHCGGYLIG